VPDEKPRRALVLSGGGSKGAFEVGVLQRLMGDEQVDFDPGNLRKMIDAGYAHSAVSAGV